MPNILIIGNGFDLYHGLPTRYSDFLNLMKYWKDFFTSYKDDQDVQFDASDYDKLPMDSRIEKNILRGLGRFRHIFLKENIIHLSRFVHSENTWLKYFIDRYDEKEQWVDFEKDMEEAIQNVMEVFNDDKISSINFDNFITTYTGYSDSDCHSSTIQPVILNKLKNDLNDFIEALRLYFVEFIEKSNMNKRSSVFDGIIINGVISFNYTNTFKNIYGQGREITIHNIHGDIGNKNLVLGIKDENDIDNRFVYFKKYFQRIQKRTGLKYKVWTNSQRAIGGDITFYVIGHSLDNTDGDIFREVIKSATTRKVIIYHHDQTAYENQVINLIEVLGKDVFLDYYENKKIEFKKLPPIEKLP